ncbi:D-serine deaminase [Leptothrix cholodnii SP-6]|uniref:D-serine deaminase n=1 Tax=Leptothrix cholodnii (strain ATCC 51168 / LMG 8142 / SP-6) TaxID=395495 RepID=B1Y614_LEPCP|nr:amino acid deaminase [Leptothrix cholodnii]ACB32361.1 D-serine deaminase [Leptothrix cholodnii SP-6]
MPAPTADALIDPQLDASFKGYPPDAPPLRRSQIAARGWNVLAGDLPLPLAVIRREPLAHNLGWMQRHVAAAGIALAPHGKTTLSPQLFAAQVEAGAWGITFANVHQLALGVAGGVRRALIANQVIQAGDLHQLAALRAQHPGLRAPFFIDSAAQLALIEAQALPAPLEVLLELGLPGGRTGCRGHEQALALARAVHASPALQLAGISTYEGLWGSGDDAADRALAEGLMQRVHALALACEHEALFDTDEVIVSAGGSALFDRVSQALRPPLRKPVLGLLRSGCYVTHDDGHYRRMVHVANRRLGCADADGLRAALQVWTLVQSCPEPGLAILNAGKRDLSFDMGLPVPVMFCPQGERTARAVPAGWQISALNDQHAYLRLGDDASALQVGDRVALGISHPCTTFDKWRWMPVVDEALRVVDAITTLF